jgi:hypothetical protein
VLNITLGKFIPREGAPALIEQWTGFVLEQIWIFFEGRKDLDPIGIRTAEHPNCSLAFTLTRQSWLLIYGYSNLICGCGI